MLEKLQFWRKYIHFMKIIYKYLITTPLKGLFSIVLNSPSLPVKNSNWYEANQLAIYKHGEFAPGITKVKYIW